MEKEEELNDIGEEGRSTLITNTETVQHSYYESKHGTSKPHSVNSLDKSNFIDKTNESLSTSNSSHDEYIVKNKLDNNIQIGKIQPKVVMSQQNKNIQQKNQMNTQDIERQEEIDRKLDEISNKITEDVCALYYNKLRENFLDPNLQTKIVPITRFLAQTLNVETTKPAELLANLSEQSTEEQARIFQKLEAQFPNIFKSEQTNINSQIDKYEQDIKDIIAAKDDAAKNAQSNDKIGRSIEKNIQYYEAEYERLKKEYLNSIFGGIREIFRMQSTAMKKVAKKMKEQRNLKEMQIKDSTESIKTALGVKSDGANGFYFDDRESPTYNASRMADKIIQNKLDKINNRSSIDVFSEMADVKTASSGQDLNDKRKQLLQIKDLSANTEQKYNAKINSVTAKKAQGTSLNI